MCVSSSRKGLGGHEERRYTGRSEKVGPKGLALSTVGKRVVNREGANGRLENPETQPARYPDAETGDS